MPVGRNTQKIRKMNFQGKGEYLYFLCWKLLLWQNFIFIVQILAYICISISTFMSVHPCGARRHLYRFLMFVVPGASSDRSYITARMSKWSQDFYINCIWKNIYLLWNIFRFTLNAKIGIRFFYLLHYYSWYAWNLARLPKLAALSGQLLKKVM